MEIVSRFRRKSTTLPICKLWHRFSNFTNKHWRQDWNDFIDVFKSICSVFCKLLCSATDAKHNKQMKGEKWNKLNRENTWNVCEHPFLWVSISLWALFSPYAISIDNSSSHKRIIKQTLIKICQLAKTIGNFFRGRINLVLFCKLRGV